MRSIVEPGARASSAGPTARSSHWTAGASVRCRTIRRVGLVLHVLPADLPRGAQAFARVLRDVLDGHPHRHETVAIFAGSPWLLEPQHRLEAPDGRARAAGFSPIAAWRLRKLVRRLRPDVVVSHGGEPLKYLWAGLPSSVPLVYYRVGTADTHLAARWRQRLYRPMVGRCQLVVAVSDDTAAEAAELFGLPLETIVVIPNARDASTVRRRPIPAGTDAPGEVVALFAGSVSAAKGADRFERVIVALRDRGVPVRGVVAGDGPLAEELRDRSASTGIEVLGHVDDMVGLLSRCDLFVFPGIDREGMPGVLIEAGLCELPVVATARPGVRDVVVHGETGFVVDPKDDRALAEHIARLVDDVDGRRSMGAAARARCCERFSMESVAPRWQAVLEPFLVGEVAPERPA
jgi:glycosyltransferase involved in cell wall biosynthesis